MLKTFLVLICSYVVGGYDLSLFVCHTGGLAGNAFVEVWVDVQEEVGIKVCFEVGFKVGFKVGLEVGLKVGFDVGVEVDGHSAGSL